MKVWTYGYRPFVMGGDVHPPVWCDINHMGGVLDLGKGYQGRAIISPEGRPFIVEFQTGGIVGDSLSDVRKDVADGDDAVMAKQIIDNIKVAERAIPVPVSEFWGYLK